MMKQVEQQHQMMLIEKNYSICCRYSTLNVEQGFFKMVLL
jgi:hypothetical protein